MRPRVARRADLAIGGAVGVGEVERVRDAHRAVIGRRWRRAGEAPGFCIQLGAIAVRLVLPSSLLLRHEPDAVRALAIVEPLGGRLVIALGEISGYLGVYKWVSARRPFEDDLE